MDTKTRNRIGLLLGGALIAVVVLASALPGVDLDPGEALAIRSPGGGGIEPGSSSPIASRTFTIIWNILGVTALILLIPSIIYSMTTPKALARAIGNAVFLAATIYIFYLILMRRGWGAMGAAGQSGAPTGPLSTGSADQGVFNINAPDWVLFLITMGVAALVLGLVAVVWRRLLARRDSSPLGMLAMEAKEAIEGLRAGAELKDVVMHCYFEMSRILGERHGLHRKEAMTPREFEAVLKQTGLPADPVERLTALFESVRYGAHAPREQEEADAIACLEAIVRACEGLT